ncbi:hypothetical protein ACQ4LE_008947 [Meloidogyne hapla]|uniref:HIG1 domain-containing protein n=1 Tax=Meloidogyne hapla TaxID=6305 RepID=A0A1I8BYX8_MELHA
MSNPVTSTENDTKQFMTWKALTPKKPSTSTSFNTQNNESVTKQKAGYNRIKSNVPMFPADLLQGHSKEQSIGFSGSVPTKFQSFVDKIALNPFIPLGIMATTGFLISMCVASYRKDMQMLQFYMRGRIAAQGFTFAAVGVGVWYLGKYAKEEWDEHLKE